MLGVADGDARGRSAHCTARNAQVLTLHCSGCLAQQTGNETMSLRHSLHTSDVFWCVLETAGARNPEPCRGQSSRHGIRTAIRSRTSGRVSRRIRSSSLTDNNSHIQSQPPGGGRPAGRPAVPIPLQVQADRIVFHWAIDNAILSVHHHHHQPQLQCAIDGQSGHTRSHNENAPKVQR